ncbi:MAG: Lpp/OprI family alanine-zipper lipoprotein [Gammaproteobacteria bacterium]
MTENTQSRLRALALVMMAAAYGGLAGCATTGDLDALSARVDTVAADAAAAKAEAAEAKAMAQDALNTANEANARSQETETKIDRMFKKAMYK